ncbi:DeoR family transcriptional regulator [Actinomycetospora termitidis]|uniref:DeoR family transcriptional regulator n=1 Tax=Actinomycetospora termitidis TaxID=3053470 RepID=A0ABT7MFL3_9PSEU|nr:DeoR family transcriptional regulator [Actinomycetospora sp. Odt1-22]MDL5159459.1 DeoR family transcriptional regulator [Actinomycetospora sp. Odt1-22]
MADLSDELGRLAAEHGRPAVVRAAREMQCTAEQVLDGIREVIARDTTVSEERLAAHVGVSRRTVRHHLDVLEEQGRIERQPGARRSIVPVEEGQCTQ